MKTEKPSSKKVSESGLFTVFNCRLLNMDAAESNTAQGQKSIEVTKQLFKKYNNVLFVRCGAFDKFGRLLVDLYSDSSYRNYLNFYLIEHPDPVLGVLATKYNGGTKEEYMKSLPVVKK